MQYKCKELKQISRGTLAMSWGLAIFAYALVSIIVSFVSTSFQETIDSIYLTQIYPFAESFGFGETFIKMYGTPSFPSKEEILISIFGLFIITLVANVLIAGRNSIYLSLLRRTFLIIQHIVVFASAKSQNVVTM